MSIGVPTWFRRYYLTIGYLFLAAAVAVALQISLNNQRRIEDQAARDSARIEEQATRDATLNCSAINDMKGILSNVLQTLADASEDQSPEAQVRRERLLETIAPLLEPNECPERVLGEDDDDEAGDDE